MKKLSKKIFRRIKVIFLNFYKRNNYQKKLTYEEYIKLQVKKTLDPKRIEKWKNEEWEIKLNGFREVFERNLDFIKKSKNALLIGSRTGQEVLAIQELGINAIGIDLVEFPPYTIKGDVHNMNFKASEFDFAFSNIIDHIINPKKFYAELNRVLKIDSIVIFHIFLGHDIDKYSVNFIFNLEEFIQELNYYCFDLVLSQKIKNSHDKMNFELIFKKVKEFKN
jgi:SAM-dependent methyltransferase